MVIVNRKRGNLSLLSSFYRVSRLDEISAVRSIANRLPSLLKIKAPHIAVANYRTQKGMKLDVTGFKEEHLEGESQFDALMGKVREERKQIKTWDQPSLVTTPPPTSKIEPTKSEISLTSPCPFNQSTTNPK